MHDMEATDFFLDFAKHDKFSVWFCSHVIRWQGVQEVVGCLSGPYHPSNTRSRINTQSLNTQFHPRVTNHRQVSCTATEDACPSAFHLAALIYSYVTQEITRRGEGCQADCIILMLVTSICHRYWVSKSTCLLFCDLRPQSQVAYN